MNTSNRRNGKIRKLSARVTIYQVFILSSFHDVMTRFVYRPITSCNMKIIRGRER